MRPRSIAASAATLLAAASLAPVAASADTPNTLYVNNSNSACTDSGTGTNAAPFCTIQAAATAASPGDLVEVAAGSYAPATISSSGTAAAPITFAGTGAKTIVGAGGTGSDGLLVSGASDVVVQGFEFAAGTADSVQVNGGSGVTFKNDTFANAPSNSAVGALHVTGSASGVTVQDSWLDSNVVIDAGVSGTILTTNVFTAIDQNPITLTGAVNTAITSNTIGGCGAGISVTGSSTGTSIENNVIFTGTGCTEGLPYRVLVDTSSSTSTTLDYNDVMSDGAGNTYSWSGGLFGTGASLYATSGQGQHDYNNTDGATVGEGSPIINSANSAATGEQTTDIYGHARTLDPTVSTANSAGPYNFYDRGAVQFQDPHTLATGTVTSSATQAPVAGTFTVTANYADTWKDSVTGYTFTTSTGTALGTSTTGSASVSVPAAGSTVIDATAQLADGSSQAVGNTTVNVVAPVALTPKIALAVSGDEGVTAVDTGTADAWNITSESYNFGDGTAPVAGAPGSTIGHLYAKGGTYTVTLTVTDAGKNTQSISSPITTQYAQPAHTLMFNDDDDNSVPVVSLTGVSSADATPVPLPDGSNQFIAVTTTGNLMHNIHYSNNTWQGWRSLGETGVTDAAIAGMTNGATQVIEVTSQGTLLHNVRNANGSWQPQGWASPGGTGIAKISLSVMPDGSTQFVATLTNGSIEHNIRFANGTWQGWRPLTQNGVTIKDASIAGMPDGSSQVIEVTSTGELLHTVRFANGSWQSQGWASPGGESIVQASIGGWPTGASLITGADVNDDNFEINLRNPNGSWTGWGDYDVSPWGSIANAGSAVTVYPSSQGPVGTLVSFWVTGS